MKWFQHQCDSYADLDLQELIEEFGISAYGFFWFLCELVGHQGRNYRVSFGKNWKKTAQRWSRLEQKRMEDILTKMAKLTLIDKKALNVGTLYIPKMRKYSDDYEKRKVRRESEQDTNTITLDKIRIDKNRIDTTKRKDIQIIYLYAFMKDVKEFTKIQQESYIKRNIRAANLLKGYSIDRISEVMYWLNDNADFKWTLESVSKYIDENLKTLKKLSQ